MVNNRRPQAPPTSQEKLLDEMCLKSRNFDRADRDSDFALTVELSDDIHALKARLLTVYAELTAQRDEAAKALGQYMAQFGQVFEAHNIPFGPLQHKADANARNLLARIELWKEGRHEGQ